MMLRIQNKFNLTKFLFEGNNIPFSKLVIKWRNLKITREQLYINSLKTAEYLLKSGVKKNERIIILLNDTPAVHEFFLGAIAIGVIPIVVNPKIKIIDLSYILKDSKATTIISEIRPLKNLEEIFNSSPYLTSRNKIIIQDRYVSNQNIIGTNKEYFYPRSSKIFFLEEKDISINFVLRDQNSPAFWQYTSGTTGEPKAVIHSQLSMLNNTINFAEHTLNITKKDCIYSIPKMFFGYGLGNSLFFPLWTGASVLIDDKWPDIKEITNLITTHKPTVFFAVPKIYSALLNYKKDTNYCESIRIFYSAGSNLNAIVNNKWKEFSGKYITQGIGCTEIGHVYISTTPSKENIGVTGKPVKGFKVKLKDGKKQGELYVQPSFKLLGYNTTNQDKYLSNNWYKTGDSFTKDSSGNYIFSSRIDDLFKVNGRMVVPSIVENYVIENFSVNEAKLVALEDENISDVITYLCLTVNDSVTNKEKLIQEIENDLDSNLSNYMKPHQIIIFKNFEYNSNGKIIKNKIVNQLKQKF